MTYTKKGVLPSQAKQFLFVISGLIAIVLGAHWLVEGATVIARALGISELIIGLTIVALGTSLPELAASIIAARHGHRDIAVGNVVGSNIINIVVGLGIGSLVAPNGIPVSQAILHFDIPFLIVTALACLPIFLTGFKISRWEGLLFLVYYVGFITFLILKATEHASLHIFSTISLVFIIPITLITILILFVRELRHKKNPESKINS